MKFVQASVEILPQGPGIKGIKKQIEIAGRTAYKSEDKITEDSCESFVNMLMKRKHGAALEHGTVYLKVTGVTEPLAFKFYSDNKYSTLFRDNVTKDGDAYYTYDLYITTNFRVLVENNRMTDLKYLSDYVEGKHEKRVTVRFVLSRGIANEFVRHRVFSFLQESTRFCNYSKKDSGVTFILPSVYSNLPSKVLE